LIVQSKAVRTPLFAATQTLLETADVLETGCLAVDSKLVVRGWNHWLESASEIPASDAIGRAVTEVFELNEESIAVRSLRRAVAGEAVVLAHRFHGYMVPLPPPPGFSRTEYMQQSARVLPHIFESGEAGAIALIEDVTERVVRERDLNEAKDRAESASKAKSEFLAAISHELRTPLTAILGYTDLMQSRIGGPLTQVQQDHLSRITAGTWHLIKIIDEILSFSRVEAKKYELSLESVNISDIVNQTTALLQQQAISKGISLDIQLPNSPAIITTDPLKVRQILLNVIGNAIKFTEHGSVTVQLRVDAASVVCVVTDTGPGIPEAMHQLVFEPFVQADQSITRAKGGTGLGLALSRSLAELLGGDLTLQRSDRTGSQFLLILPLHAQPSGDAHVRDVNPAVGKL
jgi:signal transduction histidine kinase